MCTEQWAIIKDTYREMGLSKEKMITLILHRQFNDLWIELNGVSIGCLWDVTGLDRDMDSQLGKVRILRTGEQIGNLWEVGEIKEVWGAYK